MASRKARIEDEVAELSPASFQSLAQELISQYLGYDRPTHRGSATVSYTHLDVYKRQGHFSSVRRTCQQPQATPMLVTRQFESRAFFGTRPDKSRLAFPAKIAEWRVASTPNQHCRRGDAEMASGTQKSQMCIRDSLGGRSPSAPKRDAGPVFRSGPADGRLLLVWLTLGVCSRYARWSTGRAGCRDDRALTPPPGLAGR